MERWCYAPNHIITHKYRQYEYNESKYKDLYYRGGYMGENFPECEKWKKKEHLNELTYNPISKEFVKGCSYEQFLHIMRNKETYGNELTLVAAADMLCVDIKVIDYQNEYTTVKPSNPVNKDDCYLNLLAQELDKEIIIIYNGFNHYDSITYNISTT